METDGVFNIFDRLFITIALTVATLKRRTGNKIAVGISFDDDRKG